LESMASRLVGERGIGPRSGRPEDDEPGALIYGLN